MENVIIPDKKKLDEIIDKISKDWKDKLHIISDFDKTLTKAFVKGQRIHTLIGQIREGKYLSPDYPEKAFALFDIYHPIEISLKIPLLEKNKKMHEWWKKHFDLIIESGMTKEIVKEIVNNMKIYFRDGAFEFIETLNSNKIPLIIMSAAPGDFIEGYLSYEKKLFPNIQIIANRFIWDKEGKATGMKEPIIHSMNKHETEIKTLPIYNELSKRKNVILLGDNLEDVGMVEGFPYKNLIKIGFLNENVKENLELFKKNYDIVILNDSDMGYVNDILRKIIKK